jgi:hypothetical protein
MLSFVLRDKTQLLGAIGNGLPSGKRKNAPRDSLESLRGYLDCLPGRQRSG